MPSSKFSALRNLTRGALSKATPTVYSRLRFERARRARFEAEFALLPSLCDAERAAIDVGAANGIYSMNMSLYANGVVAFEPRAEAAKDLKMIARKLSLEIDVMEIALSDHDGETILRVPSQQLGRSTIEESNQLFGAGDSQIAEYSIRTARLDSLSPPSFGLIKVDVEGHEMAVLEGATDSIKRFQPNVLVEVEERHRSGSVEAVSAFFAERDYDGYFVLGDDLHAFSHFSLKLQENPNHARSRASQGVYVNNFCFIPRHRADSLVHKMRLDLARFVSR